MDASSNSSSGARKSEQTTGTGNSLREHCFQTFGFFSCQPRKLVWEGGAIILLNVVLLWHSFCVFFFRFPPTVSGVLLNFWHSHCKPNSVTLQNSLPLWKKRQTHQNTNSQPNFKQPYPNKNNRVQFKQLSNSFVFFFDAHTATTTVCHPCLHTWKKKNSPFLDIQAMHWITKFPPLLANQQRRDTCAAAATEGDTFPAATEGDASAAAIDCRTEGARGRRAAGKGREQEGGALVDQVASAELHALRAPSVHCVPAKSEALLRHEEDVQRDSDSVHPGEGVLSARRRRERCAAAMRNQEGHGSAEDLHLRGTEEQREGHASGTRSPRGATRAWRRNLPLEVAGLHTPISLAAHA